MVRVKALLSLLKPCKPSEGKIHHVIRTNIRRSALLRENGHFLPANSFEIRKRHLIGEQGALTIGKDTEGAVKNPMQDPSMMGDQLKGQMTNMLPMIVIGG